MDTIHNERLKLTANALNTISVATIVTGLIAPLVGLLYGFSPRPSGPWWLVAGAWLCAGAGLHIAARRLLGGLRA